MVNVLSSAPRIFLFGLYGFLYSARYQYDTAFWWAENSLFLPKSSFGRKYVILAREICNLTFCHVRDFLGTDFTDYTDCSTSLFFIIKLIILCFYSAKVSNLLHLVFGVSVDRSI